MQISFTEKLLNIAARERGGRQVTSIPPTFFPLSLFLFLLLFLQILQSQISTVFWDQHYVKWVKCQP